MEAVEIVKTGRCGGGGGGGDCDRHGRDGFSPMLQAEFDFINPRLTQTKDQNRRRSKSLSLAYGSSSSNQPVVFQLFRTVFFMLFGLYFLSLLVTPIGVAAVNTNSLVYEGSCTTEYSLSSLCGSTITYPFYLPPNTNVSQLDDIVSRRFFSSNAGILLSDTCQYALLQLLCVSVFVRCPAGYTQQAFASQGFDNLVGRKAQSSPPIPSPQITLPLHDFSRPCVSVCTHANARCFDFMDVGMLGSNLLCSNVHANSSALVVRSSSGRILDINNGYSFSDVNDTCYGAEVASKIADMNLHGPGRQDTYRPPWAELPSGDDKLVVHQGAVADDGVTPSDSVRPVLIEPLMEQNHFCYDFFGETGVYNTPNPLSAFSRSFTMLSGNQSNQQRILASLNSLDETLPKWLSPGCRFALRRYVCSYAFVAPFSQTLGSALSSTVGNTSILELVAYWAVSGVNTSRLLDTNIRVPAYGDRRICDSYVSECSSMLTRLPTIRPAMSAALIELLTPPISPRTNQPSCDAFDNVTGRYMFPNSSQAVAELQLAVNGTMDFQQSVFNLTQLNNSYSYVPLLVSSSPNTVPMDATLSDDQSGYGVECPNGFVVPEDPTDSRVQWVSGTGCAVACLAPWRTVSEWKELLMVYKVCPFIGSLLGIYHGITLYLDHRSKSTPTHLSHGTKQKYPFLLFFFILSLGHSLSLLITNVPLFGLSYEQINGHSTLCNNNAIPVDNHDGFTPCAVQAGLRTYFFFGACAAWALICCDLFVKIVLQQKFTAGWYFNFAFQAISFALSAIPVFVMMYLGLFGFAGGAGFCQLDNQSLATVSILLPILGTGIVLVLILLGRSLYVLRRGRILTIIRSIVTNNAALYFNDLSSDTSSSGNESKTDVNQHLQLLRSPAIFMFAYFTLSMFLVVRASLLYWSTGRVMAEYSQWKSCVFSNFHNNTDTGSWEDVCGSKPWRPVSHSVDIAYAILLCSHTTIYFVLFHRSKLWAKYQRTLRSVWARLWHLTVYVICCCGLGRRVFEKCYICLLGAASWKKLSQQHAGMQGKPVIVPISADVGQMPGTLPGPEQLLEQNGDGRSERISGPDKSNVDGECDLERGNTGSTEDHVTSHRAEDLHPTMPSYAALGEPGAREEDDSFSLAMQSHFTGCFPREKTDYENEAGMVAVGSQRHTGQGTAATSGEDVDAGKKTNSRTAPFQTVGGLPNISSDRSEASKSKSAPAVGVETGVGITHSQIPGQAQTQSLTQSQTPKASTLQSFFNSFMGHKTAQPDNATILNMTIEVKDRTHKKDVQTHRQHQHSGGSSAGYISSGYGISSITMSDGDYLAYNIVDDDDADMLTSTNDQGGGTVYPQGGYNIEQGSATMLTAPQEQSQSQITRMNTQANSVPFSGSSAFKPRMNNAQSGHLAAPGGGAGVAVSTPKQLGASAFDKPKSRR